jgi:hypothetical protein
MSVKDRCRGREAINYFREKTSLASNAPSDESPGPSATTPPDRLPCSTMAISPRPPRHRLAERAAEIERPVDADLIANHQRRQQPDRTDPFEIHGARLTQLCPRAHLSVIAGLDPAIHLFERLL